MKRGAAEQAKVGGARMAPPSGARRARPPQTEAEREAHEAAHLRRGERVGALYDEWLAEERRNGKSARARELLAEIRREEEPLHRRRLAAAEGVVAAERDASRRGELFGAIREVLYRAPWPHYEEAERVVMVATVLLDAGRTMTVGEASRRMHEAWGERFTESALYAAKYSGAIGEDLCGVLYLRRPVDDGVPLGWTWMYHALEKAARCGAARYTAGGIEMDAAGAAAALTPRELAGAEAVMRGVNAHGEPYGLAERLRRNRGDGHPWAEATVSAYSAKAEVGAAYAELVAQGRAPDPDPGQDWPMVPGA